MATKGYNSYRGRAGGKNTVVAIVLVAVILAAAGYLIAQNYTVYDDDGTAHVELPIVRKEKKPKEKKAPKAVDVDIRKEPAVTEGPEETSEPLSVPLEALEVLKADQVPASALVQEKSGQILKNCSGDLMIPVKAVNGGITFDIAADIPPQIGREKGDSLQTLQELLRADRYTVAQLCTFCDSYFVHAYPDAAILLDTGTYWYDAEGWTWLNPTSAEVVSYITTLCKEMADLGFDEIALDYFSYPVEGKMETIANLGPESRTETLWNVAKTLRQALPEDVKLSVVLRSRVAPEVGLSYELLTTCFDRIYVTAGADYDVLLQQLPEGYDVPGRIVVMAKGANASGSYVIIK